MRTLLLLLFMGLSGIMISQTPSKEVLENFKAKTLTFKGKELPYRILYPKDFDKKKKYPLHIFLHGAGERGSDNVSQLIHGSDLFLKMNVNYPAIVIFPQCPKDNTWAVVGHSRINNQNLFSFPKDPQHTWAMEALLKLLDKTLNKKYIDTNRVYLGGLSMGGMGTFELLHTRPDTFAAATPICGAGNSENTSSWAKKTPVWIFHGEKDTAVPVIYSKNIIEALKQEGISPKASLYPDVQHDSWTNAFADPDFFPWIYSQSK